MSNENEKSMGDDHNIMIEISRDKEWCKEYLTNYPNSCWFGQDKIQLSLPEAVRVMEETVKFLNQTKNEGRHEQRTIKDKENQKLVNKIDKEYKFILNQISIHKRMVVEESWSDEAKERYKEQIKNFKIQLKVLDKIIEYNSTTTMVAVD